MKKSLTMKKGINGRIYLLNWNTMYVFVFLEMEDSNVYCFVHELMNISVYFFFEINWINKKKTGLSQTPSGFRKYVKRWVVPDS